MQEWAPIVYDLQSASIAVDDFQCDPWLPNSPIPKSYASDQEKYLKASFVAIFFKITGRFYWLNNVTYNPSTLTWFITAVDQLQCQQITIFKDGLE